MSQPNLPADTQEFYLIFIATLYLPLQSSCDSFQVFQYKYVYMYDEVRMWYYFKGMHVM